MDSKIIKSIFSAWQDVVEKKKLDPVDDKANDKEFKNRKDKDIDNDGDVDSSDEYLHKRRKATDDAIDGGEKPADNAKPKKGVNPFKKEEVEIDEVRQMKDPKKDSMVTKGGKTIVIDKSKEAEYLKKGWTLSEASDIDTKSVDKALSHDCAKHVTSEQWGFGECIAGEHTLVEQEDGSAVVTHYDVVFEHGVEFEVPVEDLEILFSESHKHTAKKMKESKTHADRTKGAAKAETMKDKRKGKPANDMANDLDADNPELAADDAKGHEDATKAGRAVKGQAPARPGEKRMGDTKIVNPVKGSVTSTTGKEG